MLFFFCTYPSNNPPDSAKEANILPSSMQFTLIKATNEYTAIPDELMHKIKLSAVSSQQSASNDNLFDISLPLYKLSNQQVSLSYEPETVEDQETIDSYGGLDNTPAYLVHLRPMLKINGERIVVAQDGLAMGSEYDLTMVLVSPHGTETITNTMIAGNLSVIGITAQRAAATPSPLAGEGAKDAERLLYESAQHYIDQWNQAEDELASLLHVSMTRPLPTVVSIGGTIDVTYLLDMPHGFTWKGVFIDADLRRIETVRSAESGVGSEGEREKTFMQLSSLQGSILENRVFEDDFQVESISTAKLFQIINQGSEGGGQGSGLLTIDKTNVDAILSTSSFDDNIKEDIQNAVNQNFAIRIPQSELVYDDWTGIGYLKESIETGESGWMLSGMIAGGMTAWSIDKWNDAISGPLSNPYSEPANYDTASAQYIEKILATDMQEGTVGTKLSQPLQVKVTDANHNAVAGVQITFMIKAGNGTFDNLATSMVATTNKNGVASATLTLGQKTSANPTFMDEGKTYYQQVGENIVDAALPSGTNLTVPFTAIGFPKDADHLTPLHGNGTWGTVLSFAGFVSVDVEDVYNNPISNVTVTFTAADPVQNPDTPNCPWTSQDSHKTYLTDTGLACIVNAPTWGTCGLTSQQTLPVTSNYLGAAAQVILGGMEDAIYTINATALGFTTGLNFYTYDFYKLNNISCDGTSDPVRQLFATYTYPADQYGNSINAGKTGTTILVQAKLSYMLENWTTKDVSIGCLTCSKVVGTRQYTTTTDFQSSQVTFSGTAGTDQGGGVYTANYTLKPGLNTITIDGTATVPVRRTYMACPDTCNTVTEPLTQTASATMQVYGVDIQTSPVPIILVDTNGYATQDYTLNYTITPAAYQAGTAYVMIYKDNEIIAELPTERKGQGFATISRGFQFDLTSTYYAQVILNFGTGVEIRSDKMTLKIILFKIVRPLVDEKILIKNDSNGDPQMQPLNAQVELKGTGIDPAMINNQNICWKFKVEYLVDTEAAPQRSRKSLDPSGAGNGADGFLIPPYPLPPAPGQIDCINYTGSTFVIDNSGNNGTTWNTNLGGGVLTITAKTVINGVEVSDTFTGKIEGEETTDQFRTQMITYLKQAAVSGNPSLQTTLGNGDILFALACIESNVNHFWPSIYGTPEDAIYPRENEGGDGGFGVMQLTEWGTKQNLKRPTYEQIWNWKANITTSIDVVNEKIAIAGKQSSELTQDQLKMNVYSLFRGGYYWKKALNEETGENDWVPRFDSESADRKEKQRYLNSGVSEADKAVANEGSDTCQ